MERRHEHSTLLVDDHDTLFQRWNLPRHVCASRLMVYETGGIEVAAARQCVGNEVDRCHKRHSSANYQSTTCTKA